MIDAQSGRPLVNGACEDLPDGEKLPGISSISGVLPWLGGAHDSLLGLPCAWRGTTVAADMVVWELAYGNGLSLVWVWWPFADFTLGPAVKMSFSLSQELCPVAKLKPSGIGHRRHSQSQLDTAKGS